MSVEIVPHHLGGKPHEVVGARTADVHDPATGAVTRRVALADAALVDLAVTTARDAWLGGWRRSSLSQRTSVLFAFRELVARHRDDVAAAIVAEHGKVLDDARGEVQRGLEVVEFACGIPHLLKGSHSGEVSRGVDAWSRREPLGVVAGITPFNFPAMVPMWMFPVAIACGNSFVLKPSERDPSAAQLLAELWAEAGLPDGVFNVVNGDREAVDALLHHPDVAAVSFVGSTPVARHVAATAAANGKRVQALGGAKNHLVVLPDADVDQAADAAVSAAYGSAGERCMAISAVVAVGEVADPLVAAVADRARAIRVGPGSDPASEMGPLISRAHRDRVAGYLDAGAEDGAEVVVDGRGAGPDDDGFWLGPSLLDRVPAGSRAHADEIFGPVLSVLRVPTLTDAIALVNASPYGNGTAVFTASGAAARRFEHEVEVGMIGINVPIPVPMAYYSFGGWKASLFGDTHVHGTEGVHFNTRGKAVTARWPEGSAARTALSFPTAT
ncbi:CoA-acylating methylmalonate-semialdehyde dehydrogenase [Nitriliruptoraceae bacterium ZYF776]|nr:CoA-acylating methylmalonate-semialdehyde dehydrogenase [Profundirhabdus halotolerans]